MACLNYEPWLPSVDVCGICGDCYCDGISCIANLDADDERDQPMIEHVQLLVRAGKAMLVAHDLMVSAGYGRGLPTADFDSAASAPPADVRPETTETGGVS